MEFEWDDKNNQMNIRKHRLDFSDIPEVFKGDIVVGYDDRQDYGEHRWIGLGILRGIVIVFVFTEPRAETIRIVSARKANRTERARYYEEIV